MRSILLSEQVAVQDIAGGFRGKKISGLDCSVAKHELLPPTYSKSTRWNFNLDVHVCFYDELFCTKINTLVYNKESHPKTIGGTHLFITINKEDNTLYSLEQMFGSSFSLEYYLPYIEVFNKTLTDIRSEYQIPLLPVRNRKNKDTYLRFWVLNEYITTLYYPNDALPRYDCETKKIHRSDDFGMNILLEGKNVVALDGWMKIPDSMKYKSDYRMVPVKKSSLPESAGVTVQPISTSPKPQDNDAIIEKIGM